VVGLLAEQSIFTCQSPLPSAVRPSLGSRVLPDGMSVSLPRVCGVPLLLPIAQASWLPSATLTMPAGPRTVLPPISDFSLPLQT